MHQNTIINLKIKTQMKKIEAIIRKTRFEDVKEALFEADINWFSYAEVHAIGQARQDRIYSGVMYSIDIIYRIEITIICRDQFVQPAIDAIMGAARTGQVGDGRIFVSPVDDTWSIRTGEHGDTVLADKK
jgi:nitrogen regulatory protein P-II 1